MSGPNDNEVKEEVPVDSNLGEVHTEHQGEEAKSMEYEMPSAQQEEEMIKKKYGGLLPKKKPLISKDHEHAFFDSADWALGKGTQKPKGPLEALRPKLQPTPHHQARSRRSAYAPTDDEDNQNAPDDHHDSAEEDGKTDTAVSNDQSSHS
ncbi:hypothetical protein RND81_02G218900 [Saponaria officinalis]|uniref:Endosulphine n=1 Tax=Saponaria officinalis TaxID=3572 RepID=A0AAW1MWE7_SAPOF